ncbi:unnamed protein product [Staurois parvus]|uniref:Uncharacterized protein n=1 Tax=Staurois parvus TaxID=386267 RepID=A0ABN9DWW7_9NEOB|nr:unnamed protein product [Staurois parvus]
MAALVGCTAGHWWALLGGTAGHRWVALLGTCGRNWWVALLGTNHQGSDHQCPADRSRSPL